MGDRNRNRNRPSLWEWIKQNDVMILILVALIMVVMTRVATHIDENYIQPTTHKILHIPKGETPATWKLVLEFFFVLFVVYILVEFVIRPPAPFTHYLFSDSVISAKKTEQSPTETTSVKWSDTFLPPKPPPRPALKAMNDWWE